ncbi:hypothetical protein [Amycolatopsis benzoatilytica]|uniref:hypothetical protein n=1 Tax=Amycolatopsis benzoatilytica TaxID=346045 RepID=UPI00036D01CC|nr:hypothetical protein [Amycolatopsis benzoatilytica]
MTAHARRWGRQCREHFERPAPVAEPKPDAGKEPAAKEIETAAKEKARRPG